MRGHPDGRRKDLMLCDVTDFLTRTSGSHCLAFAVAVALIKDSSA